MDRKKLLQPLIFLMLFIYFADLLEPRVGLYYKDWWFDIPMHYLGGLWVGLFFIYVFYTRNFKSGLIFNVISLVFVVGVLWEVYEFIVVNQVGGYTFDIFDTTSDIFLDLAGGLTALFFFFNRILPTKKNNIQ